MGTEVLLPQDLLGQRLRPFHHRRRNFPANGNLVFNNYNSRRNNHNNNGGRKTTSPRRKDDGSKKPDPRRKDDGAAGGNAVVTLLRRGESLDSLISKKKSGGGGRGRNPNHPKIKPVDDLAVLGTARIGPDSPEMLPNKIVVSPPPTTNIYAGSAFSLSPSPKSLPLPSFFNKNRQNSEVFEFTDSATRDLRRLLRLD